MRDCRLRTLATLLLAVVSANSAWAERPNVLVILADDLGYSDLGCYGGELSTPSIDRLAMKGIRFEACYNSARCCPSRASLMTGLYPHQAGIGSFETREPDRMRGPGYLGHLNNHCVTLAEVLKGAGYSTWMVGKWHMGRPGPIARGFDEFYGFVENHSQSQWDQSKYIRLPAGQEPEKRYAKGEFYATDAFTDYSLEFLQQARREEGKPWFLFLAHSAPHFPIHAPKASIDRHVETYRRGWDALRAERLERMKGLGLIEEDVELPPRSEAPVDEEVIANGYSGQPNPAWASLDADRREDLARRMATYAAMVEHLDRGVGRIVENLETAGELDNTLILFTSDNGACYEWGPFGFDGISRRGINTLRTGDDLQQIGQPSTHASYGSGWAMLANTPLAMYKHFCHEGGVRSPLVAHWPERVKTPGSIVRDPAHVMDVMATVCAATGAAYPERFEGREILPAEGVSLVPLLEGQAIAERTIAMEHQEARGLRRGDWKLVWGKRQLDPLRWELYNLADDVTEQRDLADDKPELTRLLADEWLRWAERVGVYPFASEAAQPALSLHAR